MTDFSRFTYKNEPVLTQEYVQSLRDADNSRNIIAQYGGQENMLASPADITIGGGSRGGSKAQPYDSPVVTPYGLRRMGDLKVGDTITDVYGRMQKVICITEHGNKEVFRLNFSDGTSVKCTREHLWKVKRTNIIHKTRKLNNIGQEADWRLYTTDMIMEHLDKWKDDESEYKANLLVPLCGEVKFTRSFAGWYKPQTDPYIIGAIIGDGCVTEKARIVYDAKFTTADGEVWKAFEDCGIKAASIQQKKNGAAKDYCIKNQQLNEDLIGLKLAGCDSKAKFIPNIYKYATIETRWALVQGLMDTDGMADSRGHCSYSTISETLANDLAFILRSLGAYVTVSKNRAGYRNDDGEYVKCNDVFCLYIKMRDTQRLFRLERKKMRCKPYNGGVSEPTKRIVSYEFVGYDKCRCIAVSDVSALYLTDDFTVTHNSFSLLLEALKDVKNPDFRATILRNERPDLENIISDSEKVYGQYGSYNKSQSDMTWNMNSGAKIRLSFYGGDNMDDFKKRFQGKQYAFIGIDEITHCPYDRFKYLLTDNRNAAHIRNRFWGTCNPDPDSWVAQFISWWIGEDGYPIPERDSVVRYCFMPSNDVGEIYWGDTRDEVFEQCGEEIMRSWKPEFGKFGDPKDLFIKSVCFVEAKLADNIKLMSSDPAYLANLANQDEEQKSRDLAGNWKFRSAGDDMIKMDDMYAMFDNAQQEADGVLRASADIALQGGDNLVLWKWRGWHIEDVYVCRFDAKTVANVLREKLTEWGIAENNFTYDYNGIGQFLQGFFPEAVPFNNMAAPIATSKADDIKALYKNLKSQAAMLFYKKIRSREISIDPDLLKLQFTGNGYGKMFLKDILLKERKCIRRTSDSHGKAFQLINKADMKKIVGHSPDFFESLFYRMIFDIKKVHVKAKGLWRI